MKSAEVWANEVGETVMMDCFAGDRSALPGDPTMKLIKQIQLDAWKQGMTDAAEIPNKCTGEGGKCECERCDQNRFMAKSILTARDNKTMI